MQQFLPLFCFIAMCKITFFDKLRSRSRNREVEIEKLKLRSQNREVKIEKSKSRSRNREVEIENLHLEAQKSWEQNLLLYNVLNLIHSNLYLT